MYNSVSFIKAIGILAAFLVLFMAVGVAEEMRTDTGTVRWQYELFDGGVVITGHDPELRGDIVIPSVLDEHPVIGIGSEALVYNLDLTGVTLPEGITDIGAGAFVNCNALTRVILPDSLVSISESAFAFCDALTEVVIPEGVTHIGEGAFWKCTALAEITIPESIVSIGDEAFFGCSSLLRIDVAEGNPAYMQREGVLFDTPGETLLAYPGGREGAYAIPEGVRHISDSAFNDCARLTEVTFPSGIVTIGRGAFAGCTGLNEATLPDSVTTIGDFAFMNCRWLKRLTLPDSVTSIGESAFEFETEANWEPLPYLTLFVPESGYTLDYAEENEIPYLHASGAWEYLLEGEGVTIWAGEGMTFTGALTIPAELNGHAVTRIGPGAFFEDDCGVTSLTIPDSVTSIGRHAFMGCYDMTRVFIPASVTSMGTNPFYFMAASGLSPSLVFIDVSPDNPRYEQIDGVIFDKQEKTLVAYPAAKEGAYTIPEGVVYIGEDAFNYSAVSSISIPDSVISIGDWAFAACRITSVVIPDSVESMGDWTFWNCGRLREVTLSASLIRIPDMAFKWSGIASLIIPDGVTSIGEEAFEGCESLLYVTIPESVTEIGVGAFDNSERPLLFVAEGSFAEQYAQEESLGYVTDSTIEAGGEAFGRIAGDTFCFTSGVGGWSTEVVFAADGSFTGHYQDTDMGDTGDEYPNGTRYESFFSGMLIAEKKIDEYTYELRLIALRLEVYEGREQIEEGVRVINTGAHGLDDGDTFMLYCPGRATADLPEAFLEWMCIANGWGEIPDVLPFYGLYNVEEGTGFFS